jgi:hypothetical protein
MEVVVIITENKKKKEKIRTDRREGSRGEGRHTVLDKT